VLLFELFLLCVPPLYDLLFEVQVLEVLESLLLPLLKYFLVVVLVVLALSVPEDVVVLLLEPLVLLLLEVVILLWTLLEEPLLPSLEGLFVGVLELAFFSVGLCR
jgi:hypothetical protein